MTRLLLTAMLAAAACTASADAALAKHRHRHAHIDRSPRQFVFRTPEAAQTTSSVGEFAGDFLPGIFGATTADPYQRPAYGYYVGGGRGPGYLYETQ